MTGRPLDARWEARPASGPQLEALPRGRTASWIATLDPATFAAVMATGIVGISARLLGQVLIADVLLWVTVALFVLLTVVYLLRAVRFPRRFVASLRDPSTGVAYFTVAAGANVLAVSLLPDHLWGIALLLGAAATLLWIVLTYGLLCSIVLAGNRPRLGDITGGWLIWVVGTQSVSVLATALAPQLPSPPAGRAIAAAGLLVWGVGVVQYLVLVVVIFLRLLLVETTPAELAAPYWILMGATAISVRAATGILTLGSTGPSPLLGEMRSFIVGFSVVLWSFGSWFIPMLVLFGVWRYVIRRFPWTYEPKLWSVVFPLGMYTVASVTFGRSIHFGFLPLVASVWVWVGIAGWVVVVGLLLLAGFGAVRGGGSPAGARIRRRVSTPRR